MKASGEAWIDQGSPAKQSKVQDEPRLDLRHLGAKQICQVDVPVTDQQVSQDDTDVQPKPVDRSMGWVKIVFALLSLWPPCGFLFACGDGSPVREDQCNISFVSSALPLASGVVFAVLSICPFCARHPQSLLRQLLFTSDIVLCFATLASGILIIVFYVEWDEACDAGEDDACPLRAVSLRVIVDVFGMALIHFATAYWMYSCEKVCKGHPLASAD